MAKLKGDRRKILHLLLQHDALSAAHLLQLDDTLPSNTIYVLLRRMQNSGWLTSIRKKIPGERNAPRRFYRLTPLGKNIVEHSIVTSKTNSKISATLQKTLDRAKNFMINRLRRVDFLLTEDVVLALLEDPDAKKVLSTCNVDIEQLSNDFNTCLTAEHDYWRDETRDTELYFPFIQPGTPIETIMTPDPPVIEWFEKAYHFAQKYDAAEITGAHLLGLAIHRRHFETLLIMQGFTPREYHETMAALETKKTKRKKKQRTS